MHFVVKKDFATRKVRFSATECCNYIVLYDEIMNDVEYSGLVFKNISLDFAGEYIPVLSEDQLMICCKLASAYHNTLVRSNLEVC